MKQRIVPVTPSCTVPEMWVDDDGTNHYLALDTDSHDPLGRRIDIYSHDIDAVIEAMLKARDIMASRGARMQVELGAAGQ